MVASIYAGTTHRLQIGLIIAAAATGAVVGDNIGFLIGREGGYRLLHRYGRYVHLDEAKLQVGQYLFERHGGKMVFFGRFFPVLRMWAAFLAGTHHMKWSRFIAFNAGGGIVWATLMGSSAYLLGSTVFRLGGIMAFASIAAGIAIMAAFSLVLRRNEHRLQQEASQAPPSPALAAIMSGREANRPAGALGVLRRSWSILRVVQRINWAPAFTVGAALLYLQPHLKPEHLSLTHRHEIM
jgi:membrane protein DedA with SNARE-associated domain